VSDFLECQVDVHAPFWSGLFSFDPRFSLEKHSVFERFLAWQSIASPTKSHHFFTSQVINKMIKNHSQVNKTLPKISCEKVIDFWLSSYLKLASKSVPKSIKNEPWLPYWRLGQSHSPHFGRFLRASIFELDLD